MCLGHFLLSFLAWGVDLTGYFIACIVYLILGIIGFLIIVTTKGCIEDVEAPIVIDKVEREEKMEVQRVQWNEDNKYEEREPRVEEKCASPPPRKSKPESDEESVVASPSVKSAVQMEMGDLGLIATTEPERDDFEEADLESDADTVAHTHIVKAEATASDDMGWGHAVTRGPVIKDDQEELGTIHESLEKEKEAEPEMEEDKEFQNEDEVYIYIYIYL